MQDYPPIDFVAAALVQKDKPRPIDQMAGSFGMPLKKGKVKRRGDIRR